MTKTFKLVTVILASMLIFGTSCNKYEDGPKISFRSKKARIVNTWKIIEATDADDDITENLAGITWTMSKDGIYKTGGETKNGAAPVEEGKWEFNSDKDGLIISIEGETLPRKWDITRLKNDELWLKKEQANDKFATLKFEGQD